MKAKPFFQKPSYRVPYDVKITGSYLVVVNKTNHVIKIAGHEAENASSQSLYQSEEGRNIKIGALIVKNAAIRKLSKGQTIAATTSKGDKCKATKVK